MATPRQFDRRGSVEPFWARSISSRRVGMLVLMLAILLTVASYTLHAALDYPAILLDSAARASSLVAPGHTAVRLGFLGLLLCGVLLIVVTPGLAAHLAEERRRRAIAAGVAAGVLWLLGAVLGLTLVSLWSTPRAAAARVAASTTLVLAQLAAPLLLAWWTVSLARGLRAHRVLGWVGVIGLLLAAARSLVWTLDTLLPIESGFFETAGILNVLALLGESFWLLWLLLLGFRLLVERVRPELSAAPAGQGEVRLGRRGFLRATTGLGVGLVAVTFVGARAGLTIANSADGEVEDVPSEPSLLATLYFLTAWLFFRIINPINTIAQLLRESSSHPSLPSPPPPGVTIEPVDAGGVPAERILVPGADDARWILHFHPGGFTRAGLDDNRAVAVGIARAAGANALYPDYRGTPDHPFPAGLNDCVAAYRWLRGQGVAASHIAITGESAGANLVLTTALALRESGEALPGALVAVSPPTDLAMTGESIRAKAFADPLLGGGLARDAFALYTDHGTTDLRNPLVSPVYANVQGFPPTLLLVGSEEALLSDSDRMAARLRAAGVETKLEIWPGMWHDFVASPTAIPEVRLAMAHISRFIRQHLGS